jgi:hypothetical protein
MADIILAEYRGKAWLVRGERYIDDLLMNTLSAEVSIEIMTCQSESDVRAMWLEDGWEPESGRMPWMIHPGIVNRVRGQQSGRSVVFGQWSALLDDNAHAVIRDVAAHAEEKSAEDVFLISYISPDVPQAMTDITNLRCSLIEAELTKLGVAGSRIIRETRDAETDPKAGDQGERLDIMVGVG